MQREYFCDVLAATVFFNVLNMSQYFWSIWTSCSQLYIDLLHWWPKATAIQVQKTSRGIKSKITNHVTCEEQQSQTKTGYSLIVSLRDGPWWQIIRLCSVDNLPCFFGTFEHFGIIHYDAASTCYLCLVTQHTPTNTYVRAERPWWRQWSDLNITGDENNCDRDCAIKTFVSKKPKLYQHICSTRRKQCLNPVWEKSYWH